MFMYENVPNLNMFHLWLFNMDICDTALLCTYISIFCNVPGYNLKHGTKQSNRNHLPDTDVYRIYTAPATDNHLQTRLESCSGERGTAKMSAVWPAAGLHARSRQTALGFYAPLPEVQSTGSFREPLGLTWGHMLSILL